MKNPYQDFKIRFAALTREKKRRFYLKFTLRTLLFGIPFSAILILSYTTAIVLLFCATTNYTLYLTIFLLVIINVLSYIIMLLNPKKLLSLVEKIEKT